MSVFRFKHFDIQQDNSAMKVGTDAMVLGAYVAVDTIQSVLDIGTGTGVLALMLAQKKSNLFVDAIELDEQACVDANRNFEHSEFSSQLQLIHSNFFSFEFNKKYDLIVSNPPFFENSFLSDDSQRNHARHTICFSFDELFKKVKNLLSNEGRFYFILPADKYDNILLLLNSNELYINSLLEIYGKESKLVRHIYCVSSNQTELKLNTLTIRNNDGSYTDSYKILTKDYHYVTL